jgi:hypothetical protein
MDSCNNCRLPICGNGILEEGEICDEGNMNGQSLCSDECEYSVCGDGKVTGFEECDGTGDCENCLVLNPCTLDEYWHGEKCHKCHESCERCLGPTSSDCKLCEETSILSNKPKGRCIQMLKQDDYSTMEKPETHLKIAGLLILGFGVCVVCLACFGVVAIVISKNC